MTEQNPPSVLAAGCYTAQQDRLMYGDLICAEGVVGRDALKVSASGGLEVQVASGAAWIDGTTVENQGIYRVFNDAPVNLSIGAADPTDARIDLVIARVYDSAYEGSTDEWKLEVVQGTPAPAPIEPSLPNSSLPLARVNVPAGAGEVTAADVIDYRVNYQPCSGGSGTPLATQEFTSNGSFNPLNYPSSAVAYVEVIGGGGGGGGCGTTSGSTCAAGSGGGGGGYASGWVPISDMGGKNVSVKVGAGGSAGTSGSTQPTAGAGSSFGSYLTAGGGQAGSSASGQSTLFFNTTGGAGGVAGTGSHKMVGLRGGAGFNSVSDAERNVIPQLGFGGAAARGGSGAIVGGGDGANAGVDGDTPGGGGSGAFNRRSQTYKAGGDGAQGAVYVTVFP